MSSSQFVKSLLGDKAEKTAAKEPYLKLNEDWKFTVARILMTGILKNQFYRSADEMAKEALPVLISAAKSDPMFVIKAAAFARNSHMKGMVKVALACVAGQADDAFLSQEEVRNAAIAILSTFHPSQLLQFVELMKSKACGSGFGARTQKWVAKVIENWSPDRIEEYTLKYPTDFNALVRLAHPRCDAAQGKVLSYILKDGKAGGDAQKAVERLKKDPTNTKLVAETMIDHEIPWDVIKGFAKMDHDVASAMMTQMGLTALLLNIKSLDEHGVFANANGIKAFKMKLDEVKEGRALPIDFAKPYIHCVNQKIKDLLLDAMAQVLSAPMPSIENRNIGVSVDISGSMNGETLQTAGLLSIPFLKSKSLWFTCFDTHLWEEGEKDTGGGSWLGNTRHVVCPQITGLEPREQIRNLLSLQTHGGTDVAASITKAIKTGRKLDLMVIITDEQQNAGTPLMVAWKKYKSTVNPRAELYIVNATNYEWHSADFNDPSVTVYQTMSPAMFKNLQFLGQDLVSAVETFALNTAVPRSYERSARKTEKPRRKVGHKRTAAAPRMTAKKKLAAVKRAAGPKRSKRAG